MIDCVDAVWVRITVWRRAERQRQWERKAGRGLPSDTLVSNLLLQPLVDEMRER